MTPDTIAEILKIMTTEGLLRSQLIFREEYRKLGPRQYLVDMLEAIQDELDSREARAKEEL
jgi:hypothetical protein